ncbi:MAG: ATP-dependent RecD-like DNA helicase [bacterium]|nr:ATP-dependent RecD-like DNA helicase [bacterium]
MNASRQLALSGEPSTTTLEGAVERVLHRNEDTGWGVLLFDLEGPGRIRAVGTFPGVRPGEVLRLAGEWVEHPKFGRQFRAASFHPVEPASLEGIERYLASFVDGIGSDLARKIVEQFGAETLGVLAEEPNRMTEIRGIGKKRKKKILEAWGKTRAVRDVMVYLQGLGISAAYAAKIYRRFEADTIATVRSNPYRLTAVQGIGFHRADAIARSQGILRDSPDRAAAGVIHVLEEASQREGHMFLRRQELSRRTRELLAVEADLVESAIEAECGEGTKHLRAAGKAIYLRRLEIAERIVARRLQALLAEDAPPLKVEVELAISKFEAAEEIDLAEAQRQTLREMVDSKVMVLTGGPGTGKTTLTKAIVYVASLAGLKVKLAAPTGRAAKRLAEATEIEARTIHRLLGYNGNVFGHDRDDLLEVDLLVIDEASMLDTPLAGHLLQALPDSARLILVGDVDQLPSVGPGRVLGDLIDSGELPVVRLTEIFRQARKSLIVVNAHRVIHGELPIRGARPDEADFFVGNREQPAAALAEVTDLVGSRISKRFGFDPIRDIQVLAPMRRGILGVENLNAELQNLLNPRGEAPKWAGKRFRRGDRVMQRSNNYDLEVFNGEIGTVVGFDSEERRVLVELDGRVVGYPTQKLDELELAYAVTIHKSQGSEFPCVVIVLHTQHFVMLQRNLFYTAITRGKRLVIVVGSRRALAIATRTETTHRRETLLVERLQDRF